MNYQDVKRVKSETGLYTTDPEHICACCVCALVKTSSSFVIDNL